MAPDVTGVQYLTGHRLRLTFADGVVGDVDLREHVVGRGGVFAALETPSYFAQVRVNNDIGTIVWPNGADLSPEFLYDLVTAGKPRALRSIG